MKANHNELEQSARDKVVVSNDSKILKWKQITTIISVLISIQGCFQWFKDTKMKANHNYVRICDAIE